MRVLIAFPLLMALAACGPTCEQRGGRRVPDGFMTSFIVQPSGALIPMVLQRYRCEGATS